MKEYILNKDKFVLNPQGKDQYAVASRKALLTYADIVSGINSDLAKQIREWVESERIKATQ